MIKSIQAVARRPNARRWLAAAAGLAFAATGATQAAKAQDTIKVGILHSLSGTMAISETTLKDTMLFLIDEQNKKGGLLGKKLEAVVVDPIKKLCGAGRRIDLKTHVFSSCRSANV